MISAKSRALDGLLGTAPVEAYTSDQRPSGSRTSKKTSRKPRESSKRKQEAPATPPDKKKELTLEQELEALIPKARELRERKEKAENSLTRTREEKKKLTNLVGIIANSMQEGTTKFSDEVYASVPKRFHDVLDETLKYNRAMNRYRTENKNLKDLFKIVLDAMRKKEADFSKDIYASVPKKFHYVLDETKKRIKESERKANGQEKVKYEAMRLKQLISNRQYRQRLDKAVRDNDKYKELLSWSHYRKNKKEENTLATTYIRLYVERERKMLAKVSEIEGIMAGKGYKKKGKR